MNFGIYKFFTGKRKIFGVFFQVLIEDWSRECFFVTFVGGGQVVRVTLVQLDSLLIQLCLSVLVFKFLWVWRFVGGFDQWGRFLFCWRFGFFGFVQLVYGWIEQFWFLVLVFMGWVSYFFICGVGIWFVLGLFFYVEFCGFGDRMFWFFYFIQLVTGQWVVLVFFIQFFMV